MANAKEAIDSLIKKYQEGVLTADQFGVAIRSTSDILSSNSLRVQQLTGALQDTVNAISNVIKIIPVFGQTVGGSIDAAVSGFKIFADTIGDTIDQIQSITFQFDKAALQIDQGFGRALRETGGAQLREFATAVTSTMGTTYQSLEEVISGAKNLGTVFTRERLIDEDQFSALSKGAELGGDKLNVLSSTFFVAKAAGLEFNEALNMVKKSAEVIIDPRATDGTKQTQEILASFSATAGKTGVSIEYVKGALQGAIDTVAMYRDQNTQATTTVSNLATATISFTNALQEVGVAGAQAVKFAETFTEKLSAAGMAQRAFMARNTSIGQGMGALSAGLRFEKAVGEGNFEQLAETLRSTVSRFGGGRIMRFEEAAAGGEGAARQFEVQRAIIGQMTGLQGTQARRALDILAGGGAPGGGGVDAAAELQEMLQEGNEITQTTTTVMERGLAEVNKTLKDIAHNTGQQIAPLASLAGETLSNLITPKQGPGGEPETEVGVAKRIRETMQDLFKKLGEEGVPEFENMKDAGARAKESLGMLGGEIGRAVRGGGIARAREKEGTTDVDMQRFEYPQGTRQGLQAYERLQGYLEQQRAQPVSPRENIEGAPERLDVLKEDPQREIITPSPIEVRSGKQIFEPLLQTVEPISNAIDTFKQSLGGFNDVFAQVISNVQEKPADQKEDRFLAKFLPKQQERAGEVIMQDQERQQGALLAQLIGQFIQGVEQAGQVSELIGAVVPRVSEPVRMAEADRRAVPTLVTTEDRRDRGRTRSVNLDLNMNTPNEILVAISKEQLGAALKEINPDVFVEIIGRVSSSMKMNPMII